MAVATATVPDAKAALLSRLRARPGLQGVQVEWSHPGKTIQPEAIYLGDVPQYTQRAAGLGNRCRDEDYILEIVVTVEKPGNDPETCERRCWDLLGEVEGELRANADLDKTASVAQYESSPVRNYMGERKRVSEAVVSVRVSGEI